MRRTTMEHASAVRSDKVVADVVKAGVLGGVPGMLVVAVPVLLTALDLITADQSQIGFLGVPIMVVGIFIGAAVGAGRQDALSVTVGVAAGLIVGVAVGGALAANGVLPGLWLLLVPVSMIAGGAIGGLVSLRTHPS